MFVGAGACRDGRMHAHLSPRRNASSGSAAAAHPSTPSVLLLLHLPSPAARARTWLQATTSARAPNFTPILAAARIVTRTQFHQRLDAGIADLRMISISLLHHFLQTPHQTMRLQGAVPPLLRSMLICTREPRKPIFFSRQSIT